MYADVNYPRQQHSGDEPILTEWDAVPTADNRFLVTPLLTVWRRLHVEVDSMGAPADGINYGFDPNKWVDDPDPDPNNTNQPGVIEDPDITALGASLPPAFIELVDPRIRSGWNQGDLTSWRHFETLATAEFMKNYVQALVDGPYREADVVRFWTLDGGRWCQCPQCQALGIPTDRNLLLVDRLDQAVKQARAEGRISRPIAFRFLAYADVLDPPTRSLPEDFDYRLAAATFYPIVRCYVHNFDDPRCARNAHYCRQLANWATDPRRHYRGRISIGEYYNVSGYKSLPVCFMHTMANDIPYFYQAGARQFQYMHVTTGNWGNKALTNYQMARQLWDVGTDCQPLWQDYFAGRYGPAAEAMRRFYESLEKMLSSVSELKYGLARRLDRGAEDLFPTPQLRYRREPGLTCDGPTLVEIVEHARTCRALIDQVSGMKLPERINARIAEDERMFTYGERTVQYFHECVQAFQLARAGQREEARRHYAEAGRLAELLREDTTSTTLSSEHANAPNAFVATYATGALDHLAKLLGPLGKGGAGLFFFSDPVEIRLAAAEE